MAIKIGTAKYQERSNITPKHYFDQKFKEGDNIFRILPPIGNCAETGQWVVNYKVHFGFYGSPTDTNPKGPMRPFLCVEQGHWNNKEKVWVVDVHCPECDKIAEVKGLVEALKNRLVSIEKSCTERDFYDHPEAAPLLDFLARRNMTEKGHLNAKEPSTDKIGLLKIGRGTVKDLKKVAKELSETYMVDPTAPDQGVLFNIKRSGSGRFNTKYDVLVVKTISKGPNGRPVEEMAVSPLTETDLQRMETECHELLGMYTTLTVDQVQRLVDADASPEMVDEVFAEVSKKASKPEETPVETSKAPATKTKATTGKPKVNRLEDDEDVERMFS